MALLVFLIGLGAPYGDTLSPYRGQTIVDIEVDAPVTENEQSLVELLGLEIGYLLSPDDLEVAVKRLYALGRFSAVEVYATRRRGTISLRFVVTPIERLGDLEITGLDLADPGALREALRFRTGAEIDATTRERVTERALEHLEEVGFPEARAELEIIHGEDGEPSDAILRVQEGPPMRIDRLSFTGATRVKQWVLTRELESEVGGVLNRMALSRDRERLVEAYRAHGFLTARVSDPEIVTDDAGLTVLFAIDAGPRVAFHIVGNTVFDPRELERFAPPKDAPLTDGEVRAFVERIDDAYTRIGRFTTRVDYRGYRDPEAGIARYVIRVEEGPRMEVVSLRVPGAKEIAEATVIDEIRTRLRSELSDVGLLDRLDRTHRCLLHTEVNSAARDACDRDDVAPERRWVPTIYASALDSVSGAYQNLGYLKVRVGPPELEIEGTEVRITIPIVEGPQTRIRSLSYKGNRAFGSAELLLETYEATSKKASQTPIEPGGPFSRNGIEDARIAMVRAYRDRGYLYGRIFSDITYSEDQKWADVRYRFDEGPQVRINRILVRGNRYTNESVIRSRISLESGDIYRLEQALADQRSISELGVFETVRVRLIDENRPAEQKDLVAEVSERNRQPIEIAPGISTAEGPRLQASYSHINLFGTAGQLSVLAKINRQVFFELYGDFASSIRQRFEEFSAAEQIERVLQVGLRSPRYVNLFWEPTARAEVVTERDITLSYDFDSTRLVFGVDLQPTERLRVTFAPEISLTNLTCASQDTDCLGTAQGVIGNFTLQNGERRAIKIGPVLTYDARDNPFFPSSGYLLQGAFDYSIGRSRVASEEFTPQSFVRGEAIFSTYFPLGSTVLALGVRAGHIRAVENEVPIFERFFLGGRTTLRGFPERTLIPEDCAIVGLDAPESGGCQIRVADGEAPITQGGNNYALLKGELRVPLIGAASVGFFVDAGNLWFETPSTDALQLRTTFGTGLRYNTPVGPLALDVGVNPDRRRIAGEGRWSLHFTVGVF